MYSHLAHLIDLTSSFFNYACYITSGLSKKTADARNLKQRYKVGYAQVRSGHLRILLPLFYLNKI